MLPTIVTANNEHIIKPEHLQCPYNSFGKVAFTIIYTKAF
jgi:hypothetical protein